MSHEQLLFSKLLKKVRYYFKISGAYIDEEDINRNPMQRLLSRKLYWFNIGWVISHLIGEVTWGIIGIKQRTATIVQLTYTIPGITLCLVGIAKSYFFINHGDLVIDLIRTIKLLQIESAKVERGEELEQETKKRTIILSAILTANNIIYAIGLTMFGFGPIIISWLMYKSTGDIVMQLPFLAYFPFDETDIRYWPYAYIHQMWTSVAVVSMVHGSDSFYAYACTFLLIQFRTLHYDIERLCPQNADFDKKETQDKFKEDFRGVMIRHNELIRCIQLVEDVYSKSTLVNLAVSAMVMCVSAFNVATIDDIFMVIPFIAFLVLWVLQVFVLCYYSDLLIESSTAVSDAVYHSNWYDANAATMKDLLFVLTRAQKPCKLTAAGYTDLNLKVFNRICSSAWSYFALLRTVYSK